MTKLAEKLLASAPSQWAQKLTLKKFHPPRGFTWQDLERELNGLAQRSALLAAYISTRKGLDGCGEKDHREGVKQARKTHKAIRKALGFTNPEAGTFNF